MEIYLLRDLLNKLHSGVEMVYLTDFKTVCEIRSGPTTLLASSIRITSSLFINIRKSWELKWAVIFALALKFDKQIINLKYHMKQEQS